MKRRDDIDPKRVGLQRQQAAKLLGVGPGAVSRTLSGERHGALVSALRLLVAVWPRLDPDDQAAVLAEIAESQAGDDDAV